MTVKDRYVYFIKGENFMELGSWAIVKLVPLLALIPLLIYIVLSLRGKNNTWAIILGITAGMFLNGLDLKAMAKSFGTSMSSSTALIGIIIMAGAGLGQVMTEAHVTHTLVYWIVKRIGVNTQTKAKLVLIICSIVICGLLGTLGGGNAVIAPIMIPVMASLGITPTVVAILFKISGEMGLVLGPLTGVTLITMEVTGLTYGQLMIQAAVPFAVVFLGGAWVGALRAQERTQGKEAYTLSDDMKNLDEIVVTKRETVTTIAFLVTFFALVVYGIITKQDTAYALIVMMILIAVVAVFGHIHAEETITAVVKGVQSQAGMFIIFITIDVLLQLVTAGGGFTALGNLLGSFSKNSPTAVMLISSLVGGFGIEAAAVAEIKIIAGMFLGAAKATGLPMGMFAISILCATRLTGSTYPCSNMNGQMGIAGCDNLKEMLQGCWIAVGFVVVATLIWSFVGLRVLG